MTATREFVPRLMPAPQAAHYLGVSVTKLRELPIPRVMLGGKRLFTREALDAFADSLPVEGEGNLCDAIFGHSA
jgi:excisionase family DNA binding protein